MCVMADFQASFLLQFKVTHLHDFPSCLSLICYAMTINDLVGAEEIEDKKIGSPSPPKNIERHSPGK